jgi:hypothetical protein
MLAPDGLLAEQAFMLCAAVLLADGQSIDVDNPLVDDLLDRLTLDEFRGDELLDQVEAVLAC